MLSNNEKTLPLLNSEHSTKTKNVLQSEKINPDVENTSALNITTINVTTNHPDFFDELHNANFE